MPRLVYETPCRPRPTPPPERDRSLAMIKVATSALAVALVAGFYVASGGSSPQAGTPTAAPASVPSLTSTPPVLVAPPVSSTVTSEVGPTRAEPPPPPATPAPSERTPAATPEPAPTRPERRRDSPPGPDPRFAVLGESCSRPGAYAVTERYQPAVCRDGVWRRAF